MGRCVDPEMSTVCNLRLGWVGVCAREANITVLINDKPGWLTRLTIKSQ